MEKDKPHLTGAHQVVIGDWALEIQLDALPAHYDWLVERSKFAEEFDLDAEDGRLLFAAVYSVSRSSLDADAPLLVVAQRYSPYQAGFDAAFLIVPETARLFIGAGERLLCYDLRVPARLWIDKAWPGFWRWGHNRDYVWMLSELEFGVWTPSGEKLWTTFVEPPWGLDVRDDIVELDIMGRKSRHRMADGTMLK
jgi:hypothetical protein